MKYYAKIKTIMDKGNIKKGRVFSLKTYINRFRLYVFLGPFFKAIEAATEIFIPFLMAMIIDNFIPSGNITNIYIWTGVIIALNVIGIITAVLGQKYAAITTESIGRDIRKDIFTHVNSFSHSELDKFSTASILNRTIFDVYHIQEGISLFLRNALRAPFILIGSIVMAIIIDVKLSLIFVIVIPILMIVVMFIFKKLVPLLSESKIRVDKTSALTRENLAGQRVVRAFNKQNYEVERFDKTNTDLLEINIEEGKVSAALIPIVYMIVNLSIIALIYFGGFQINLGNGLTQGNLIAFINYFNQVSTNLIFVARLITMFTRVKTSSDRINDLMSLKNSITDPKRPINIDKKTINGKVEFIDVSFSYNGIKNVVENLSFTANPGEVIGIIGGTGSGKSSVVNLIPRFYDATRGKVLVDDEPVFKYRVSDLRNKIGIVMQNPILFAGTIRSNMTWAKPNASDEEIIRALKIAQAYEFVSTYPEVLSHHVSRGGTNFSGGQRQRLTIARALVGDPKILILDDSSSALDFATDAKLRNAIKKNLKATIFIVSQRTNALKNADKIIVLEAGKVVGMGRHKELIENCEIYREIHLSQQQGGENHV